LSTGNIRAVGKTGRSSGDPPARVKNDTVRFAAPPRAQAIRAFSGTIPDNDTAQRRRIAPCFTATIVKSEDLW